MSSAGGRSRPPKPRSVLVHLRDDTEHGCACNNRWAVQRTRSVSLVTCRACKKTGVYQILRAVFEQERG